MKKRYLIIGGAAALVAGWALFRPELLFIDTKVNEGFPGGAVRAVAHTPMEPASMSGAAPIMEAMPTSDARLLAKGDFRAGAHDGRGMAAIYELAGGRRVLRLSDFETSNGPDLRVVFVAAPEAPDTDAVKKAGYEVIAALKGNQGNQNYDLPPGLDLGKFRTVCIWCNRFSVNFASAPLK